MVSRTGLGNKGLEVNKMEIGRLNRICAAMVAEKHTEFQEPGLKIRIQEVNPQGIIER